MIVTHEPHAKMTSLDRTLAIAIKGIKELVNGVMILMNVKRILVTTMQHASTHQDPLHAVVKKDFMEMVFFART